MKDKKVGDKIYPMLAGETSNNSWTIRTIEDTKFTIVSDLNGVEKTWDYAANSMICLDPYPVKEYIDVKTMDDIFKIMKRDGIDF